MKPWSPIALVALAVLPRDAHAQSPRSARPVYDIVIAGGRVIDPETRLDGVRNVGITGGRIAAVTREALRGRDTIDARGLVVAPGFIDLHSHGQNDESYRYKAMDGVTTALELESGVFPIASWYAAREGHAVVNFGASTGHIGVRQFISRGAGSGLLDRLSDTSSAWAYQPSTPALEDSVRLLLARGLDEGGLGIGMGIAYVPGASPHEILGNFALCAERKVVCFTHMRGGFAGLQEVIFDALTTGASLHVVHINSSGGASVRDFASAIDRARTRGVDVTTEAYPYTASSTLIQSALFDSSVTSRSGYRFDRIIWVETGEHLTAETFKRYRAQGGLVIQEGMPDSAITIPYSDSSVIVASDGIAYVNGRGHPRLAGTFARVLGKYVRGEHLLTLADAVRRMTYLPARRLQTMLPAMSKKGRVQVGADADVTVFDANRVIDRATYEQPAQYSAGIVHVLVGGTPVVRGEKLVDGVAPGRPVRRPAARGVAAR